MLGQASRRLFGGVRGPVLVYGEAGAGKTNLALEALREAAGRGSRGFYLSTEGRQYAARVAGLEGFENVFFAEASSLEEQSRVLLAVIPVLVRPDDLVVVDTINALYRLEFEERAGAARIFAHIGAQMGILYQLSERGVYTLVTGQVHGEGDEASGMWLVRFWARRIMRVERRGSLRRLVGPSGEEYWFEIAGRGIRWLEEARGLGEGRPAS